MHKEKAIKKIRYVITTLVVFMAAIMGKSYFSVVEANAEETEHSAVYVESKGEDSISAVQVTSDNVAASEDKSSNVKTGWKKIDDKWYYYDSNSVLQKSKWINTNSKWYYFGTDGVMQTSKWISGKYYVKDDGTMAISEWVDAGKYYVGADGKWIKGYDR